MDAKGSYKYKDRKVGDDEGASKYDEGIAGSLFFSKARREKGSEREKLSYERTRYHNAWLRVESSK